MNQEELRQLFPALERSVYNRKLVYLDNAATSQRPQEVIDVLSDAALFHNANIHRAVHCLASEATELYEQAREEVRSLINAPSAKNVIFTSGATAALNLAAYSFSEKFIGKGDEVIVGVAEHHSNLVPWQIVCERRGAKVIPLPVDEDGTLEIDKLDSLINDNTRLICVSHASNVLGIVNPVEEIVRIAHSRGVRVMVDGAQGIVHLDVDVQRMDCDFYAFSGHKIYAATGTGVLYVKEELAEQLPPFMGGGEMIATVSFDGTSYAEMPYRFEAGTPNFNAVPTLVPAIRLLRKMRSDEELNKVVENVVDNYKNNHADEKGTQIIFLDLSVAKQKLKNISLDEDKKLKEENKTQGIESVSAEIKKSSRSDETLEPVFDKNGEEIKDDFLEWFWADKHEYLCSADINCDILEG